MVMYSVGSEHAHRYIDRLWRTSRSGGSGCTRAVESQDTETVADATEVTDDATDAVTDTDRCTGNGGADCFRRKNTGCILFCNRQHSSSCADDRRYSRSRSV